MSDELIHHGGKARETGPKPAIKAPTGGAAAGQAGGG